ncbi:MAG: hypothetical protein U1E60_03040 [Reyranellaceae bacterium]
MDNSATMGSHRLPKAAAMIGFEGWLSSNQGGRNACREAIRIEWKSGDANGFRLPCQAGVECGAVENVQCAGVDAGFLPCVPRRREATRRKSSDSGFRGEQQDLFECALRQVTDRLGRSYVNQASQYSLPFVVGEGGRFAICRPPRMCSYACCIAFARRGSFQPGRMKWHV